MLNDKAIKQLITSSRCALADLIAIMPDADPSGDRKHSGWKTITDLYLALKRIGEDMSDYDVELRELEFEETTTKTNKDFATKLRNDFYEWSGGFAPESPEQIEIYIQSAMSIPDENGVARRLLENWMNNPDEFEKMVSKVSELDKSYESAEIIITGIANDGRHYRSLAGVVATVDPRDHTVKVWPHNGEGDGKLWFNNDAIIESIKKEE